MKRPTRKAKAFTLVEMLVVIFIIAILVTIVVGVARDVIRRSGKDQTRTNMEVVLAAIEEHRKIKDDYPAEETDFSGMPGGWTTEDWKAYVRGRKLYEELASLQQAQEILSALEKDAMVVVSGSMVFADGFGKHLDYRKDKGAGGMPLLVSAGPDGDFATQEDNIRSDDR